MNYTKGVNAPGFDSTELNKADVKAPLTFVPKVRSEDKYQPIVRRFRYRAREGTQLA